MVFGIVPTSVSDLLVSMVVNSFVVDALSGTSFLAIRVTKLLLVPEAISSIVLVDFMVGVEMVGFDFELRRCTK